MLFQSCGLTEEKDEIENERGEEATMYPYLVPSSDLGEIFLPLSFPSVCYIMALRAVG